MIQEERPKRKDRPVDEPLPRLSAKRYQFRGLCRICARKIPDGERYCAYCDDLAEERDE